jgi:hypothetical protein
MIARNRFSDVPHGHGMNQPPRHQHGTLAIETRITSLFKTAAHPHLMYVASRSSEGRENGPCRTVSKIHTDNKSVLTPHIRVSGKYYA